MNSIREEGPKTDATPKPKTRSGGRKRKTLPGSREKAILIAQSLEAKKVSDILVLDVEAITSVADFFVVGTCESQRQIRAVAESVDEQVSRRGGPSPKIEGLEGLHWVLMDYSDVIVHIFDPDTREYYALERLWGDAPKVAFQMEPKKRLRRQRG